MTLEEMEEIFERNDGEFLKFDRVVNKRSRRADLHAFIMLDEMLPGEQDMIAAAEHDEIYLVTDAEELAAVATSEQVIELIRCGVRIDHETDSLAMFR